MQEIKYDNNFEIVCMPTSIKIFQFYGGFPPNEEFLKPKRMFYIKFALRALGSSLILVGSILHLISNIKAKAFNHVELDIAYIVAMLTGYALMFSFFNKMNVVIQLYRGFSNFAEFEKPLNFEETNDRYNRYAKIHFVYLQVVILFSMLGSNMVKVRECREENQEKHIHETCGLYTYAWLPFDFDFTPVRQLYLAWQLLCAEYIYSFVGLCAWMVVESVAHLVLRLQHVGYLFKEALEEEDFGERRKMFSYAVRYHKYTIGLAKLLNEIYSVFMFTHMVMTSAIMGYGMYAFLRTQNFSTFFLALGWLNGLLMVCYGGQRMQDESLLVGEAVYNAQWFNCDVQLKRELSYVILRCQKQMNLKAAYLGSMGYPVFLAVLKASYSYITLMKNTENRNH